MIKISTLGGYNEVGKNMTAVRVNDDVIILDMGLHIENYIRYTEDEDVFDISAKDLLREDAIPDIAPMEDWKDKVKAIIPTHAHLDHVGALPFLSNRFKAPILCTPYTKEVINAICRDDKIKLKNEIKALTSNSIYHINDNIKIEFINITHSTPQTVMVALHTKEGTVLYANDFKFDNYPVLGKKPDITKLESLKNVKALVCDSTRAEFRMKTPSESVAREMLRDVMDIPKKGAMIATTFSSHLARLKTIMSFATQIKRKPIFMGRSLSKYIEAGEKIGLINFSKQAQIVKYSKQIGKTLRKLEKDRDKYLFITTGHQGEPKAVLSKIASGALKFNLNENDNIIFSCTTIPSQTNIENRKRLEKELEERHVRMFKDIHVSGHASREDLRELILRTKPQNIVPAHCEPRMAEALKDLALEMGYNKDNVMISKNGNMLDF